PVSPPNRTPKLSNVIRSGSSAWRFAFSILEIRLEYVGPSTTPSLPAHTGHGDSRSDVFWARGPRNFPGFALGRRDRPRACDLPRLLREIHGAWRERDR